MNANEVRQKYLDFMKQHGHVEIQPAPSVLENDPTTLFTGSGMQPLLPYLLGQPHKDGVRLTDSQPCVRLQDIDDVGDPRHTTVFEMLGNGLVFNKFTGSRGKSGSNDANAEYIAAIRNVLDKDGVIYQTAELGKVDIGGGGTIAYILALYGMNVIDAGVAVLNMHAPWECISKADLYEAYEGYKSFIAGIGQ